MSQQMHSINCKDCYLEMMFDSDRFCFTCENCQGTYILLTPQCKIVKIGIELEGGWYSMPDNAGERLDPLHSYSWHSDSTTDSLDMGSCGDCDYCNDGYSEDCENGDGHAGEIVSYPMIIGNYEYGVGKFEEEWHLWTKRYYPQDHNSDCGAHFHISFDNIQAFEFLCTKEFFDHFQRELYRWGVRANIKNSDFWSRLNGDNTMCRTTFRGAEQLYTQNDSYPDCRYSILNFQYHKHGTLEFRILPVFDDVNIYIKAVQVCMDITQKYLDKMANHPIEIQEDTREQEIDFSGRISNTMIQEYMNEEPIEEELEILSNNTQSEIDIALRTLDEAMARLDTNQTDLEITSNHREENGNYVIRYEWVENFNTDHDESLQTDFITNIDTDSEETHMARTRRFVRHFNQHGNDYARVNFMNEITWEDFSDIA